MVQGREPSRRDIARLYLFALALGFQGRYRGQEEHAKLAGLREELFQFAYPRQPELSLREQAPALGRVVFVAGLTVLTVAIVLLAADLWRALHGISSPHVLSSGESSEGRMR